MAAAAATSACLSAVPSCGALSVAPPVAKKVPHEVTFGVKAGENRGPNPMRPAKTVVDPYFWVRDDSRSDEEVLSLLRSENAYTASRTAALAGVREALYEELLSHVKEDDDTVPYKDGAYSYFSRTTKGKAFREFWRSSLAAVEGGAAKEVCYLDVNAEALKLKTPSMCDVGEHECSPSGRMLAFAVDDTGYETYDIVIRDLQGDRPEERIKDTAGNLAWADEATLFYVRHDTTHRPYQVWRHVLGTALSDDVLVFEEKDDLFNVGCARTRDGALVVIEAESKETTEARFILTADPTAEPKLVRGREFGVRYDLSSHAPTRSIVLTSNAFGLKNRQLYAASWATPDKWQALEGILPHSEDRSLDAPTVFRDFLAVSGREGGFTQVWTVALRKGEEEGALEASGEHRLECWAEDSFSAGLGPNCDFDAHKLRVTYSSMTTPRTTMDYDVAARTLETLKVTEVLNYDAALYETWRIDCPSRDGATSVPVTLLWRKDHAVGGKTTPLDKATVHLYGYGSYGICIDPSFAASRLPLVDRGVVYAIAHVRGGGEMGHSKWYEDQGKYLTKHNTFFDFVDCASHLKAMGLAGDVSIEGRSAGGLLVGNAVNIAPPGTFAACVAGVPFVDLMVTMCDPSIPLTTEEWEEWGNPNEAKYYDYMRSYSPIDNVIEGVTYPKMLLVSGLNDPRVAYWEPTKWAQVLRERVANGQDVLLKMDLDAGHFSASDRYKYLRELAFDYAWLLDALGKLPSPPPPPTTTPPVEAVQAAR